MEIEKVKQKVKQKVRNKRDKGIVKNKIKSSKAITLIALVITTLFSYDEMIKFSNSKGFLLAII